MIKLFLNLVALYNSEIMSNILVITNVGLYFSNNKLIGSNGLVVTL